MRKGRPPPEIEATGSRLTNDLYAPRLLPDKRKATTSCRAQIGESNGTQTGNQLLRLNANPLKGFARRQAQPDKRTQVGPNYAPTRVPFTVLPHFW